VSKGTKVSQFNNDRKATELPVTKGSACKRGPEGLVAVVGSARLSQHTLRLAIQEHQQRWRFAIIVVNAALAPLP
jgi:hypothetical protein